MAPLIQCSLVLLLSFCLTLDSVQAKGNGVALRRQKREWIIAPRQLKENHDYTGLESVARIRSDKENFTRVIYSLTGPGVDQDPVGVFSVNPQTGYVKIHTILDREEYSSYHLKGVAKFLDGSYAENDIDLKITVRDENDCPPVIQAQQVGYVKESSAAGTIVMTVIATDADQVGTKHSQIFYSLVEQSSSTQMFYINSHTGEVMVRQNTLDRETQHTYTVAVQVFDMNGEVGGNSGTGNVTITLLDINDNIPTLEKESYEGSVEENTINVEVMRIKAIDMDMMYTDNWLAVFQIVSGNEAGYFSITTDSKTNEGIIMINKALDYEVLKVLNLGVAVSNKAEYDFGMGGSAGGVVTPKPYPIKINVINQKEGPRFQPSIKVVTISEDRTIVSINKVITNYAAIDSDTLKIATNVKYAKLQDDDNWLIIDEKTADIRLNKLPDRESKFLINGTYYAKIICISNEVPAKTATGTIAIKVEDSNDNCPILITTAQTMCIEEDTIFVTAVDVDQFPNAGPYEFMVIEKESEGKWTVEHLNETTAILRDNVNLWSGTYKVALEIKDQQGKSCGDVQMMDVIVCTCHETTNACVSRSTKTAGLGAAGVLLLLLGLLLLLLVPLLLLFCLCGGAAALGDFKAIPFDAKQQLISYHTEGQGEDKEVPLLQSPIEAERGAVTATDMNKYGGAAFLGGLVEGAGAGGGVALGGGVNTSTLNMHQYSQYGQFSGHSGMDYVDGGMMTGQGHASRYRAEAYDGLALSDHFLGEYYSSKANHAAEQSQQKDALLVYDYEGRESLAGSVGCCSLLENDNDLAFLDDLGPKFKTLADICQGSTIVTESVDAAVSVSPPRPVSPAMPSASTHTHVHTHTETIKDREHVNINTLNTSNVASESTTVIQEQRLAERAQGSATISKVHVQDNIVIPTQTLLIQQPALYYTTAPMYVVESKPQMVLVAGGTQQAMGQMGQMGQMGLMGLNQGLVQVGSIQGSQGMVLVERQGGMDGAVMQTVPGFSQGTASRSRQVLMVDSGSAASGAESGARVAQAFIQTGQGSAGQAFVQTGQGSAGQGFEVRGQGAQVKAQSFSQSSSSQRGHMGSYDDFGQIATPNVQGSQKVVVQHKKVTVTETNTETGTRAEKTF